MALPTKTITFNNLASSTTMVYEKVLTDNFYNATPFLTLLNEKKKVYSGGTDMNEPLLYNDIDNVTSYSGYDVQVVADIEQFTTARLQPAHYKGHITIAKTDLEQNRGSSKVFDLIENKFKNLELSLRYKLTADLFGSETAYPKLIGLQTVVYEGHNNTYAGIDSSTETWWANNDYDMTSLATLTMAKLQSAYGEVSDGARKPDVGVTTQAIYDAIWNKADAKQRMGVESLAKLGFTSIEFNGIPIIVDKACSAGNMYFLNLDTLFLRVSDQDEFSSTPWLMNTTQLAKVKYVTWTGQLVCTSRRDQTLLYNLD